MTNSTEKPATESVEEKKVVKEPATEPESTTKDEPELNGNGTTEEVKKDKNGHTEEASEEGNGHVEEEKEAEETTLKRKEAPTEDFESPKKKKLIDSEQKEPDTTSVEA